MCILILSILKVCFKEKNMKIGIIGSRSITDADIGKYVSAGDEIVSGGATGIDTLAAE